ncbi:MAG: Response regulator receiver protein [Methanomicrobiales archaeon 53_19]|jgi:CheY-like chemotaxis protein|uniref:response regulator n=1 Tax=Methanocalculus sp. TaxID=2004547 RepID=UPI000749DD04|nr:response regulator [Methanocalculus sp.]KUK69377.1 MAG: Response regulator receiver protein [Methanocalculus sp. 52_23]KUL04052.1 MAG: Response regulator receiver protein [Methanomicrobiales archaeon 53_19]HIJ06795.1 response regulator [Methanocalculus sp.]
MTAKILVIDDNPGIVEVFVTMLKRGGYTTYSAGSGAEGLDLLMDLTPDLILLDIMMEPMDGWETLENIKLNPATRDIPVLMLTAKQLTPDEAEEYGMYIEDYIIKPITHTELYESIEHVLKRRHAIEEVVRLASERGVNQALVSEYARLVKSVDVNRRLIRILENTHSLRDRRTGSVEKIENAINSMKKGLQIQESRLEQLRDQIGI